jgi:PhnB protein
MVRIALRILGSVFYISDMAPEFGGPGSPGILDGTTVAIHIEDSDPDALYDRAIAAGGMPVTLMQDMFWGERQGLLRDPFGHRWSISAPGNIDEQSRKAALKKRDP